VTERVADPQAVCPFVAFDDERDFRSSVPDHRHRCFAESPAAPRALAHQAAYCLSSAFPSCPTFVDWARREAAPAKVESPPRSLRGTGVTPRAAPPLPAAPGRPPVESAPGPSDAGMTAPPGPAGAASAGEMAGGATPGLGRHLAAGRDPARGDDVADPWAPAPSAAGTDPAADADDTPSFLAGRSRRPPPAAWDEEPEPWGAAEDPLDDRAGEPASRRAAEPRRVPVGYAPVAAARSQRGAGEANHDRRDPVAPSWEQPRRFEAYPTLKSRGPGGIPRLAAYALIVVLVGVVLFALPLLLQAIGGGGADASPTPAPSASVGPTVEPSATPVPTPEEVVYIVKSGDSLSKIAAKYGVTVDQVMAANPDIKNPNLIAVGDRIVIPRPLPSEIVDGDITPAP
jgi:LysM repeat protein